MSQEHSHTHMALSKHSKGYISDKNRVFVILKTVRQTNKKYHWAMESQPENIQGAYSNNECLFSYAILGNVVDIFSLIA